MINDKEFKLAWQAGWDAAIGAHAGVVAAAERIVDLHMGVDAGDRDIAASIVSLASSVNNLKTTLERGLDFR